MKFVVQYGNRRQPIGTKRDLYLYKCIKPCGADTSRNAACATYKLIKGS